jgi:hypothetical protein
MAWDGSASRWPDADSYCACCLIDENPPGKPKSKSLCHIPVKDPGGKVNPDALGPALAALNGARGGTKASSGAKAAARAKLMRLRSAAGLDKKPTSASAS